MFQRPKLSREQSKALTVLEENLSNIKELTEQSMVCLNVLSTQDYKGFFFRKVNTPDLPRGDTWLWNQSRSRKQVKDYTGNINLSFYKLNTRSSQNHASIAPNNKIWVFNLTILPNNKEIAFVWCERGQEKNVDSFSALDISDLTFLNEIFPSSPLMELEYLDFPIEI